MGRKSSPDALTEKQSAFVDAYCGEARGNGVAACRMAGYTGNEKTLTGLAAKLLKSYCIVEAIQKRSQLAIERANGSDSLVVPEKSPIASAAEIMTFATAVMRGEECLTPLMTRMGPVMDAETGKVVMRPAPPKARIEAARLLGDVRGLFLRDVDVRAGEAFRSILEDLRKVMSPAAFDELIRELPGVLTKRKQLRNGAP